MTYSESRRSAHREISLTYLALAACVSSIRWKTVGTDAWFISLCQRVPAPRHKRYDFDSPLTTSKLSENTFLESWSLAETNRANRSYDSEIAESNSSSMTL